jgi:hypothetical protein
MLHHARRNAVAYLALFVALSGTSYAALRLPSNSVGKRQIRRGAVTASKLHRGAVTASKLARGAVTASALAKGVLVTGARGASGPSGPRGPKGDTGAKGDAGVAGQTFGFAGTAAPSTTPEHTEVAQDVTLPTGGRLFVTARANVTTNCSTGVVDWGIYVDSAGVGGSGGDYAAGSAQPIFLAGVSAPLSAGQHTLTLQADCVGGNRTGGGGFGDATINAVLLGG